MAGKKPQTVFLKEVRGGTRHPFVIQHALNLLRLQEQKGNKGWLIDDKNWQFVNNEITRKPNKRKTKEADE